MVKLLYTLFNVDCYWRINLKVFIVCLDNEPFSVHKSIEDAHNWVIGQEWDSDHLEQGDFDYSVFFDSESARVYANDPYMPQSGGCLLTIKIFEMED